MSLIYNTLEKIEGDNGNKKPGRGRSSKKKKATSPASLIGLAIIISAILYAGYSGVGYFDKNKGVKQPVSQKTRPVVQEVYTAERVGLEETPQIPDYELVQEAGGPAGNGKGLFTRAALPDEIENYSPGKQGEKVLSNDIQHPFTGESEIENASGADQPENQYDENYKMEMDTLQLNKTTKIINLVSEINRELQTLNNEQRLSTLITELKKLSGKKNNYVLKIEAVIQMKKMNYTKAEDLLKKVITAGAGEHREAKINLAIIELNTGRNADAKKRLTKLGKEYPEDVTISQLLKQCRLRL